MYTLYCTAKMMKILFPSYNTLLRFRMTLLELFHVFSIAPSGYRPSNSVCKEIIHRLTKYLLLIFYFKLLYEQFIISKLYLKFEINVIFSVVIHDKRIFLKIFFTNAHTVLVWFVTYLHYTFICIFLSRFRVFNNFILCISV